MDPAEALSPLRLRQALGAWLCGRLFRRVFTASLASQIPMPGLQLCYPDETKRFFCPLSGEYPHHSILFVAQTVSRQVARRHIQIPPTALAPGLEAQGDGVFRPGHRFAGRFRPVGENRPSACKPVHIIAKPLRHQRTYRSVLCCGPFAWDMGDAKHFKGRFSDERAQ